MVLSTKDRHEVMENLSIKCSAYCSLLPPVTSIPSKINPQEPSSNEATSSVSTLITQINSSKKIKGELRTSLSLSLHCNLNLVADISCCFYSPPLCLNYYFYTLLLCLYCYFHTTLRTYSLIIPNIFFACSY